MNTVSIDILRNTEFSKKAVADFFKYNDQLFVDPFSSHVDIEAYVNKLDSMGQIILAYDKVNICGIACAYMNDKNSYIAHLQVLLVGEQFQNKGIGKELLNRLFDLAKEHGMKKIELTVDNSNVGAIHLYKSFGFEFSQEKHENLNKSYMILKF